MSCIDLYLIEKVYPAKFFSIHCVNTSGLKLNFQSYVFDNVRNKLVSANCTATSNVLTVTDENYKRCIFPILSVHVPRSYHSTNMRSYKHWLKPIHLLTHMQYISSIILLIFRLNNRSF